VNADTCVAPGHRCGRGGADEVVRGWAALGPNVRDMSASLDRVAVDLPAWRKIAPLVPFEGRGCSGAREFGSGEPSPRLRQPGGTSIVRSVSGLTNDLHFKVTMS
jgi:hypothetical protein